MEDDDDKESLLHTTMVSSSLRRHKQRLTESYSCFKRIPHVLILFCGGTLIMQENKDGSLVVSEKDEAIQVLLGLEPHLNDIAHLEVHYVDNIDSTNMTPVCVAFYFYFCQLIIHFLRLHSILFLRTTGIRLPVLLMTTMRTTMALL